MGRPSFIEAAHKCDAAAIKAEIASTEMHALAVKYNTTESSIREWEVKYKVTALRRCRYCKRSKPISEMEITSDGRVYVACLECATIRNTPRPPRVTKVKKNPSGGAAKAEMGKVPVSTLLSPRMRLSDQQGSWNRYEDRSWESTSENQEV